MAQRCSTACLKRHASKKYFPVRTRRQSGVSSQRCCTMLTCPRTVGPFVDRSHEAIRQWVHRLKHLFESDCQSRQEVAVDETMIEIDGEEVYVWAAVDRGTLEVLAVDVSPGRSNLDAFLFLKEILKRCRGRSLARADRGPWYDWSLERLDCEYERVTWGNQSLIEAWFGPFKYRTRRFWHRFPYYSTTDSTSVADSLRRSPQCNALTLTPLWQHSQPVRAPHVVFTPAHSRWK